MLIGYFPVLFNDIGYKGKLPAFKLWGNISHKEYNSMLSAYSKKQWSFIEESLNYCRIDCIALFEVLTSFNELVFQQFDVNIHKSLTLPSLAMRVYKSKYMPENTIYQLNGRKILDRVTQGRCLHPS